MRIDKAMSGALKPSSAAGVAELVDALDLGSSGETRGGSSPSARTIFYYFFISEFLVQYCCGVTF